MTRNSAKGQKSSLRLVRPKIRLFVDQPLGLEQRVRLSPEQAHYLFTVMRLLPGNHVALFNGRSGEWVAVLEREGRRGAVALPLAQSLPHHAPPDLWLLFPPLRKARLEFLVEKAVELGVSRLVAVKTDRARSDQVNVSRLATIAIEAAEQCGATVVPEIAEIAPLADLLRSWPQERALLWADEALAQMRAQTLKRGKETPDGSPHAQGKLALPAPPVAVLVGPEGGFSEGERALLLSLPQVVPLALGPRILRAETAALAALVLWQAHCGDWAQIEDSAVWP